MDGRFFGFHFARFPGAVGRFLAVFIPDFRGKSNEKSIKIANFLGFIRFFRFDYK